MLVDVQELIFFTPVVTLDGNLSQVLLLFKIVVVVGDVPTKGVAQFEHEFRKS